MGGFFLMRAEEDGSDTALAAARAQFERHGFTDVESVEGGGFLGFFTPPFHGRDRNFVRCGEDFIAVAGTLSFGRKVGDEALSSLLADFEFPFTGWDRLHGQFALLLRKAGRLFAFTDYFAAFQLFHDHHDRVFSTSFLAASKHLERLNFDAQGVYEFAFNVFPTGNDTVFREITRLGPRQQLELAEEVTRHYVRKPLPARPSDDPLRQRIDSQAAHLRALVAPYAAHYGDDVQCPLSGGLDSRLALALLRDAGVRPRVYVYGQKGDEDVKVARHIAAREGFELEINHKSAYQRVTPDDFAEIVERNFHETDALVTDGGLFDNGGNAAARHARQAGGQLAVSGGCGEVFRNFFYLPNRRMTARQVMRAFFARYAPQDLTGAFDEHRFFDNLEEKALRTLGEEYRGKALPRPVIEQLYPRMRCRAFFGREISLVGRQGGYLMPFFDHEVVAEALTLPLALKNAGRFEAALLTHIDPALAAYPSAYGFAFDQPPSRRHRLNELGTRIRPPWMRAQSYALRRRLGPMADEHGGLLTPAFLGRVLDLHFPHMRRFFKVPNIADSGLYRRVATLEYLAQHVETRL